MSNVRVPVDITARIRRHNANARKFIEYLLGATREHGITALEAASHPQAPKGFDLNYRSAFSWLHSHGRIVRLAEKRNREYSVYVLPEYAAGRDTIEYHAWVARAYQRGYDDGYILGLADGLIEKSGDDE